MRRVLEAYQALHVLHYQISAVTDADRQYAHQMMTTMPEPISTDPSSYTDTLQWWRSNYSDALLINITDGYLATSQVDEQLQTEQQEHNSAQPDQAQSIAPQEVSSPIPTPTRELIPIQDPPQHRITLAAPTESRKRTTPSEELDNDEEVPIREPRPKIPPTPPTPADSPPYEDRPTTSRRRSRYDIYREQQQYSDRSGQESSESRDSSWPPNLYRAISPRSLDPEVARLMPRYPPPVPPPRSLPCAFCSSHYHYTSDCTRFPRLSDRARLAVQFLLCSNCVKQHRGMCKRRDPCSYCRIEGHHRAFCMDNPRVYPDVKFGRFEFYRILDRRTFRPCPQGMVEPRKHKLPLKLALALCMPTPPRFRSSFRRGEASPSEEYRRWGEEYGSDNSW